MAVIRFGNGVQADGDVSAAGKLRAQTQATEQGDAVILGADGKVPSDLVGGVTVDDALSDTSENPVQNKVVKAALDDKQPAGDYATSAELQQGLATKQPTGDYALKSEIPDVSGFETSSHATATYATKTEVTSGLSGKVDTVAGSRLMTDAEGSKLADIAEGAQVNVIESVKVNGTPLQVDAKAVDVPVPTTLSGLTNDAGFVTATVNNLINYYLKSEIDNLIDTTVNGRYLPVDELPDTGEQGVMYLVPKEGSGSDVRDEYIYVNNGWELVGSTAFNLDITQGASGITINGTPLQSANAQRAGLMTAQQARDLDQAQTDIESQAQTIASHTTQIAGKADSASLAAVATSGSYNDLSNKPTIPTIPGVATGSSNGLMSAADKAKLDGVAAGANNYVLPIAGTALGGVKSGGNVTIDTTGAMSVDLSGYQPAGSYLTSVPIGGTAIGGVKNGGNVTIEADGTMKANVGIIMGGGLHSEIVDFLESHTAFLIFIYGTGPDSTYINCIIGPYSDTVGGYATSGTIKSDNAMYNGGLYTANIVSNSELEFFTDDGMIYSATEITTQLYATMMYWD